MMLSPSVCGLVALLASTSQLARAQSVPSTVAGLVSQYGLSQSDSLPQPDKAMSSNATSKYLTSNWDLNKNKVGPDRRTGGGGGRAELDTSSLGLTWLHPELDPGRLILFRTLLWICLCFLSLSRSVQIQAGAQSLSFVSDPFDSSSSSAVLAVKYGQGSYGGGGTSGGAQFYVRTHLTLLCHVSHLFSG